MKYEGFIGSLILVPLLVFFLSPYGMLGFLLSGIVATIAGFLMGITKEVGIKEMLFITSWNLLVLVLFYWAFALYGVKMTVDITNLMAFVIGGLIGGFLYSLKK
ncbi:MAG: hypothetical protein ACP5KE_06595 [Candidatus Methanodesulfokora sp.]|jgi:hypothetical protein